MPTQNAVLEVTRVTVTLCYRWAFVLLDLLWDLSALRCACSPATNRWALTGPMSIARADVRPSQPLACCVCARARALDVHVD